MRSEPAARHFLRCTDILQVAWWRRPRRVAVVGCDFVCGTGGRRKSPVGVGPGCPGASLVVVAVVGYPLHLQRRARVEAAEECYLSVRDARVCYAFGFFETGLEAQDVARDAPVWQG